MMRQYFEAKDAHPGVLVAMRVGDFYEFYGVDAEAAARILGITLTGREDAANGRIPMAGVPYHSVEKYLARLVAAGEKVALCDQIEDPKKAKGLVKRAVTRVLTPGTVIADSMLEPVQNNFLVAVARVADAWAVAALDPSTGDLLSTESCPAQPREWIAQEIARLHPSEVLIPESLRSDLEPMPTALSLSVTPAPHQDPSRARRHLLRHFKVAHLRGFGAEDWNAAIVACSTVLTYAETMGLTQEHVAGLTTYTTDSFLAIDPSTRRSLELTQNLVDGSRRFTLLESMDRTVTSMGARLLRRWIDQPLIDRAQISARHESIAQLVEAHLDRGELRAVLRELADIERLVARCSTGTATPRDLSGLRATLVNLPRLGPPLMKLSSGRSLALREQIADLHDLAVYLERAVEAEPPAHTRDGGFIRAGFEMELDKLRELGRDGRSYIAQLEAAERERTGITSLKVGFNSVFGYFLEVPKAHVARVPEDYIRKQTTANAERYITVQLKEHESAVLGASDKAIALEQELFRAVIAQILAQTSDLMQTARALAELDVLAALAEAAVTNHWVRPDLVEEDVVSIAGGRHPVVEAHQDDFVPNDLELGDPEQGKRTMVLTGPNMSGKSTYLRQVALIAIMAQTGSFVPAQSARMGVTDRIFARIGAKDELALGQSTFMVEMIESAFILNHATSRSLVILDEVGRGTSTFDGLAIAWAMVEKLVEIRCKTLFATHYHQLNALAEQWDAVFNCRVAVQERGDDIVWTHRVLPGATDRSYGIHVARMAGVPRDVLGRAEEILRQFEGEEPTPTPTSKPTVRKMQLTLFETEEPKIVQELRDLNIEEMTPIQALALLDRWKIETR